MNKQANTTMQGPNSQNFFSQIRKIFVTLGPNILGFLRQRSVLLKKISIKLDVLNSKSNKIPLLRLIGPTMLELQRF